MKKVCIDARMWGVQHTGIGRYIENLIDNLPVDPGVEVVLIVSPQAANEPKLARFKKYLARQYFYSAASLVEMFWLLLQIRPDLLHVPHINAPFFWPGKMIVTVHDLIKHQSRGMATTTHNPLLYWWKYVQYLVLVKVVVHRADHLIVPTQYWKNELVKRFKLNPNRISVTYEGVDKSFAKLPITNYQLPIKKPYLLYVGNLYPHKNVPLLIEAVGRLKLSLGVVCARSIFEKRLPKSPYVHYLGQVDDQVLARLYAQAEAFVFPSLIEGFGLPGLEAMSVGCPVIAARASCLPEVYGDAALYFDPRDVDHLVGVITKLREDDKLRQALIRKGLARVKTYSWAKMAKNTWQIYQTVLH